MESWPQNTEFRNNDTENFHMLVISVLFFFQGMMISKKIIHLFKCRLQQCKVVVCGHSIPVWCFLAFVIFLVFQCALLYQISLVRNHTTRYEMQTKRKTITWFCLYHGVLRHHTTLTGEA